MKISLVNYDTWIPICSGRYVLSFLSCIYSFFCHFSLIRFKISLIRFSENIFLGKTHTSKIPVYLPLSQILPLKLHMTSGMVKGI